MALEINKPLPLEVGGEYMYTLSSYDAPEVDILQPTVSDADVAFAAQTLLAQSGKTLEEVDNDWIKETFHDFDTKEQFLEYVRTQVTQLTDESVEMQKHNACIDAVAARLEQAIPQDQLAQMREALNFDLEQTLEAEHMTREQFSLQLTGSDSLIEQVLDQEATKMSQQQAALDAWARHKQIEVQESELPHIMGIPEEDAHVFIDEAKNAGALSSVLANARRAKAAQDIYSQTHFNFIIETAEQAEARVAYMQQQQSSCHDEGCCCHEHDHACECHDHDCDCDHDKHEGFHIL